MSELQDMLRVQARLHRKQGANALGDLFESAAKEINQYESALKEWIEKTEWVQNSANANELGVHRADALSLRISDLKSELAKANERVKELDEIADTAFKYNHSSAECLRAWRKLQQLRKEQG
ncbi:MAG: hypothetical protein MK188_14400 [Gammaproteobacteria bacterium]|nr:hypothetical protein [Gammaproteobacteria bacterium]